MTKKQMGRSPLAKVPTPKISAIVDDSKLAYSMREVSQLIGLSERSVFTLVQTGKLRAIKLGRLVRIPRDAIDELLGGAS